MFHLDCSSYISLSVSIATYSPGWMNKFIHLKYILCKQNSLRTSLESIWYSFIWINIVAWSEEADKMLIIFHLLFTNQIYVRMGGVRFYSIMDRGISVLILLAMVRVQLFIYVGHIKDTWALIQYKHVILPMKNPIVDIRRSDDRLISTMGFPILVRGFLYWIRAL